MSTDDSIRREDLPLAPKTHIATFVAAAIAAAVAAVSFFAPGSVAFAADSAGAKARVATAAKAKRAHAVTRRDRRAARPRREIPSLRTRTSKTFVTVSGGRMARVYSGAVHYRDTRGRWRDIDSRLTPLHGRFLNRTNNFSTSLPLDIARDTVRIRKGSRWLKFRLLGARGKGAARGSEATYRNAFRGVDVAYRAQTDSVKETMTLRDRDAHRRFSFDLSMSPGLRPSLLESDALVLRDREGRIRLSMAAPFMVDAAGKHKRIGMRLVRVDGRWRATLQLSNGWLDMPGRRWPVVVDPTVFPAPDGDCWLDSSQPETSLCASGDLKVGRYGTVDHQSVLRFNLSAVPRGSEVQGASLIMWKKSGDAHASNLAEIKAQALAQEWTGAASWNRNDGTDRWSEPGGEFDAGTSAEFPDYVYGGAAREMYWHMFTIADEWISGRRPNHGLLLRAVPDTPGFTNGATLASNEFATVSQRPFLEIAYSQRVGARRGWVLERQKLSDRIGLGVNVASGNLQVTQTDFSMPGGLGPVVSVSRAYNSMQPDARAFGPGWKLDGGQDFKLRQHAGRAFMVLWGPGGFQAVYRQNANGTYATPAGFNNTLTRDAVTGIWTLTDHSSQTKYRFESDTHTGRIIDVTDRNGRKLTYDYGTGANQLRSISDSNNDAIVNNADDVRFTHVDPQQLSQMTDPAGRTYSYGYTAGRLTSYTDPQNGASFKTLYEYNGPNNTLSKITTPQGNITTVAYYPVGHVNEGRVKAVTRVTDVPTLTGPTTTFEYHFRKDGSGYAEVTDPIGSASSDGNDRVTRHEFDDQGRVTRSIDALGRETSRKLTTNSNVESYTAAGNTGTTPNTTFTYDAATDNLTGSSTPTTAQGTNPMTASASYGGAAINAGTPGSQYLATQATNEQGGVTKTTYQAPGDAHGNPDTIKRYQPDGTTLVSGVAMQYATTVDSKPGQISSITDGRVPGRVTAYGYDGKGNVNSIDPPGTGTNQLGTTTILYDANLARVSTVRDGNGACRVLSYDNLDRVLKIEFRGACVDVNTPGTLSATEPKVEYTYDRDGNQTAELTVEEGTGTSRTRSMSYDKLNRVTFESLPGGASNTYTYDLVGNLRSVTDAGGKVEYTYDAVNQQRAVYEPGTTKPTKFTYNKDGLREDTTYPNGVTIDWSYDHASRVIAITSKGPGGTTTLQDLAYQYRQHSTPNRQTPLRYEAEDKVLGRRTRYDYDGLDRLIDATTKTSVGTGTEAGWIGVTTPIAKYAYALDGAGNITQRAVTGSGMTADTRNFAYDEGNQLCWRSPTSGAAVPATPCATGTRQTAFDANGNETTGATGTNRTAAFHLTDQTKTLTIGATPTSLVYLGAGQDRWITEGTGTFQHNVLGAGSRTVGASSDYFTRDESGTLVSRRNGSTRHYYLFDALGSVTGLVNSSGTVAERYDYDPYGGRDMSATGASASADVSQGQFGYAGGYRSVGGLYHYGQRYYDPLTMRWTQADPLDQTGDLHEGNRYAYAAGDPVASTDPTGTDVPHPSRKQCKEMIKLLTQYRRLCDKLGIKISEKRLAELDRKRRQGTIRGNDLPAKLRRKFPSNYLEATLDYIKIWCGWEDA